MLAEGLKRNRVMDLTVRFTRIVQMYEIIRCAWLSGNRIGIVMLSSICDEVT